MPTRLFIRALKPVCLLAATLAVGCDRPDPVKPTPATRSTEFPADTRANDADTAADPFTSNKTPADDASIPAPLPPPVLNVAGQQITFPPAVLHPLGSGILSLTADGDAAANTFSFQLSPDIDPPPPDVAASPRNWTHATWSYELTNPDEQPMHTIRSAADPDNGLRPVQLEVTLTRAEPTSSQVQVTLSGRFVTLNAIDPLKAKTVEVTASFTAKLVK